MKNPLPSFLLFCALAFATPLALGANGPDLRDDAVANVVPMTMTFSGSVKGPAVASFGAAQPQIFLACQAKTLTKGDKIKAVWVLEDGGKTVPPNSKVSESTIVATERQGDASFSLTKPATGWPLGKWRVDLYVNNKKSNSREFNIR